MLLAALALAWRGLGVKLSELGRHLQVPVPDPSWDQLSVAVEASRCAALLRSIREGPVIDLGPASMISAWLLRQGKVVLSLGGSMAGLVQVEASLEEVLEALERLRRPPALIFVQAATLLAGGLPALASQVPVMGAMLTDQGQEVPHWVLPSLVSPLLNTSRLRVELPCWSNSCEGEGRQSTKLLALVMIVKSAERVMQYSMNRASRAWDKREREVVRREKEAKLQAAAAEKKMRRNAVKRERRGMTLQDRASEPPKKKLPKEQDDHAHARRFARYPKRPGLTHRAQAARGRGAERDVFGAPKLFGSLSWPTRLARDADE
ncbi:unnamed protein product [Effrenium voratum]|nr:unnamed protein product [Effrenium voratum]